MRFAFLLSLAATLSAQTLLQQTYDPRSYDFAPQTPGGNLSAGPNTITMRPCPKGLIKTGATASAFYIYDGVGTAEPVRATGGGCIAGATSGTLTFTTANVHAGSWKIKSATAGIDLACASNTKGAHVVIFPGDYNIYGTIRPTDGCTIDGQGRPSNFGPSGPAVLHMQTNALPMFDNVSRSVTIQNVQLAFGTYPAYTVGGLAATAGSVGIQHGLTTPNVGVRADRLAIENVHTHNFYDNIVAVGEVDSTEIYIKKVYSLEAVHDGYRIGKMGAGFIQDTLAEASGNNGYTLIGNSAAIQWSGTHCFANNGWGLYIGDGVAFHMVGIDCEANKGGGIYVGVVPVGIMSDVVTQSNGDDPFHGTNNNALGMYVAPGNAFFNLSNFNITANKGSGLVVESTLSQFTNGFFISNGLGAQAGNQYCIKATGTSLLFGNMQCYGNSLLVDGASIQVVNSSFIGPSSDSLASAIFTSDAQKVIFASNQITNPAGTAMQIDSGASLMRAPNSISGTVTGTSLYTAGTEYTVPLEVVPNPTALTVTSNAVTISKPVHTLGAGLIKTITPPNSVLAVCTDIIATAAFTTDQTANIASPAMTAVIGNMYRACYNPGTVSWYITR